MQIKTRIFLDKDACSIRRIWDCSPNDVTQLPDNMMQRIINISNASAPMINDDPRHHAIETSSRKPIDRAAFGDWAMAYRAGVAPGSSNSLVDVAAALLHPIAAPMVRAYFE